MNIKQGKNNFSVFLVSLLVACTGDEAADSASEAPPATAVTASMPAQGTGATAAVADCADTGDIAYLCGVNNGEDILRLGSSGWLLVSGMDGSLSGTDTNGRLHLVEANERQVEALFPGTTPVMQHDSNLFRSCPGPLDVSNFSAHGLALQKVDKGPDIYHLYMTSHGAREAIEVFEIDAFLKPTIKWIGCVPMPATSWTNSVTILNDGGFLATQFFDPGQHTIANVMAGENTGHVFEWHPGEDVSVIPETGVAGANGIALTDDERWIYVAAFGTSEIIRFDRSSTPPGRESIPVGVSPDNIRWTDQGTLLTAGNNTAGEPGWSVYEIVPYRLAATRIAGAGEEAAVHDASTALRVGNELWVGTFSGDRLAILPASTE